MSATNSTAITGQSNNVGPLVAAVALAAVVAVGAVGLAITHGVGTTSTSQAKAGPAVVAQRGLVAQQAAIAATKDADASVSLATCLTSQYVGSEFAAQYQAWLKGQQAAAAASFPDYFQRIGGSNAGASRFIDGSISSQHRMPQ